MRRILIAAAVMCVGVACASEPPTLEQSLGQLPGAAVTAFEAADNFAEAWDLRLEQPLDHKDPGAGSFSQRITVEHRGFDRPVVLVTEGYALGENLVGELAAMLGANQVRMEHRFEGDSAPAEMVWEHLTIEQAAADAHRVRELLGEIYPGPWVATGWSKGGQAAVIYRWFHPDDVAATVAYDAPLPRALEDPRVDAHFKSTGSAECRQKITAFQRALLENKPEMLELFADYVREENLELSIGEERVFEYGVLEFPFSFWQYSAADCDAVPVPGDDPAAMVNALVEIVGFSWFGDDTLNSPSFHQFCTELGFYGYDEEPFADLLSDDDYPMCIYAPDWEAADYDPGPMEELHWWLRTEAVRIMSIYGEMDPWSAPAMPVGIERDQIQFRRVGGNHFTVIESLSLADRMMVRKTLASWLDLPLEEVGE